MDYTPISLPSVADDKKSSLVGMLLTELGKETSSTLLCSNMWKSRTQDLLLCRVSTLKGAEHLSYTLAYLGCKPVEAKVQRWKALLTSKESQSTTQGGENSTYEIFRREPEWYYRASAPYYRASVIMIRRMKIQTTSTRAQNLCKTLQRFCEHMPLLVRTLKIIKSNTPELLRQVTELL